MAVRLTIMESLMPLPLRLSTVTVHSTGSPTSVEQEITKFSSGETDSLEQSRHLGWLKIGCVKKSSTSTGIVNRVFEIMLNVL